MMQSTPKPRNASDKLRELKAMHSALLLERGEWDNEYENIARFFAPRKYRNTEMHRTNSGSEKREFMDDEGIFALRTMAAGMHSGLTSQARPWFRLTLSVLKIQLLRLGSRGL